MPRERLRVPDKPLNHFQSHNTLVFKDKEYAKDNHFKVLAEAESEQGQYYLLIMASSWNNLKAMAGGTEDLTYLNDWNIIYFNLGRRHYERKYNENLHFIQDCRIRYDEVMTERIQSTHSRVRDAHAIMIDGYRVGRVIQKNPGWEGTGTRKHKCISFLNDKAYVR